MKLITKRKTMAKLLGFVLLLFLPLHASQITIAVAANVGETIGELQTLFQKAHPDITVNVILGSSGKLSAQIQHGAPYGLFMSANMQYPQYLYHHNLAVTKPRIYAKGLLALFSTKKQNFSQGLKLLTSKTIRSIAIANPKTAPYGKAAFQVLNKADLYAKIKMKLVYAESVSQCLTYARTAADIGLVARASLSSVKMKHYKQGVHWHDVNPKLYEPLNQGIVLLKPSLNNEAYQTFYDFILSDKSQRVFQKYGYQPL